MGQHSWIYSDTKTQVIDNLKADTYLLIPKTFHEKYGTVIYEPCYDGYGHFGGYDVYDLVPEWNKEMIPEIIRRIKKGTWFCDASECEILNLQNYHEGSEITCELRDLGILMACEDEGNFALEYPIKITSKEMAYEDACASESDPNQGRFSDDFCDADYYEPEEEKRSCRDCPDDECTGHCMSCYYRPV